MQKGYRQKAFDKLIGKEQKLKQEGHAGPESLTWYKTGITVTEKKIFKDFPMGHV